MFAPTFSVPSESEGYPDIEVGAEVLREDSLLEAPLPDPFEPLELWLGDLQRQVVGGCPQRVQRFFGSWPADLRTSFAERAAFQVKFS